MTLSLKEEKKLIADCCSGKRGSWERFVEQYSRLIYYSIQRTCQIKSFHLPQGELEDIYNDIFVSFIKDDCKKLRQYRGDNGCSVASWIRTI